MRVFVPQGVVAGSPLTLACRHGAAHAGRRRSDIRAALAWAAGKAYLHPQAVERGVRP
jgi:hypothetical protein